MKQLSIFELIEPDYCETCLYCEDCRAYNIDRFQSCIKGSNYISKEAPQFPESDFAEIVGYINNKLGLNFKKKDGILEKTSSDDPEPSNYYETKVKKGLRLTLSKGKFFPEVNNGAYFIGVGYDIYNRTGGSGPVDTVGEALDYFEDVLNKYK